MDYSFGREWGVLMIGAVIGSAALIPYSFKLLKASTKKKSQKLPPTTLAVLSFMQNVILGGIMIGVGLFTAHRIGLGAPTIAAWVSSSPAPYSSTHVLLYPAVWGVIIGVLTTVIDLAYLPYWPKPVLNAATDTSLLENFCACFYGGFNEEYLARLLGVSVIAWLLSRIGHHSDNIPTSWVMWTSIIIMAVLFAIGHLPALKALVGKVSGLMLSRTLVLNIPLAVVCGWMYWKYGIETAIITHFVSDVIYHVGGTMILKGRVSQHSI